MSNSKKALVFTQGLLIKYSILKELIFYMKYYLKAGE